ncbi:unnamed protein product [Ostreobium quekettii]|uniref:CYTH domain-containing protein n=1 Tax=Ostreobium quekettii TaxID=121088 RepID=A0A8S1J744_9CHLO|nr:unnamed protein product [Ostreobium quekettii]
MPGVGVISMDNYNDASKVVDDNFDDPRLTDYDLLLENMQQLRSGKTAQVPIYDFKESKRVGYMEVEVPTSRIVIVEGIYALSERLRGHLDLRVSITGGVHFDLIKRVLRDLDRSGQAPEEIIQQISDTVYPMYKAFIEPDLETAHLKIHNTFNPFSGFMNATYILKSDKPITIEQSHMVLKGAIKRSPESELVDIYLLPPGEDPDTCSSWLRMRNRDGRYSLLFEEWVTDGPYLISPRISFEVSVKVLGGLMALGYEIGTLMKRKTVSHSDDDITVKLDTIEKLGTFVQVQGKDRAKVAQAGRDLGLEGSYIARSYIEQVQLEKLTSELRDAVNLREHLGDHLFSGSPVLLQEFPASLPARLRTTFSTPPVAIERTTSLDPSCMAGGTSRLSSGTGDGLLSQRIRASPEVTDGYPHNGVHPSPWPSGSLSTKDELVHIMRQVSDRLNTIAESVSAPGPSGMATQVEMLQRECSQMRQSVACLSKAVDSLSKQVESLNGGLHYDPPFPSFGYILPPLLGVAGFGVLLGWVALKSG